RDRGAHDHRAIMIRFFLPGVALLLVSSVLHADVTSGPKTGDKVEDFMVFGVTGLVEGKEVSYVKERKDEPTVYVFVQQENFSRLMSRFLKTLDTDVKESNPNVRIIIIFLTEKPDMTKEYLPKLQNSLSFAFSSLAVFMGEKTGPKRWEINTDAHLTAVVVSKGKVAASLAYKDIDAPDISKIKDALKKVSDAK
ncbi:MAG: hypothetical protein K8T89_25865, partial [Planctomycetes bacterium]|nr:hypothetical protein [Planctomycetota bacterium]